MRQLQAEENLARTGIADGDVWDRLDSAPRFTGNYKKVFRMELLPTRLMTEMEEG